MSDTPTYDKLVDERLGRAPHEFDGYDSWDQSEEARAAFDRGAAEALLIEHEASPPERVFARHARDVSAVRSVVDR
ncbi:hypothetical protein SAMN05421678_114192 [Actinopolymorpha cephalotaxi]|uniref:Uncharacterized protein n=1 Tax=Actinopolymorpha cephalotaxi TaxID=504797 RepID=A0A1I2YN28_9ACTN|nr:hypothetical protein [Actinopolymorpha cephalotaxi]NYH86874.1 hypothetical protein [Actinopolymorpha cephalotaxi]SFH26978.1 hypothetical protein SAMN05421678_114192 [Actinopolymorpha cephalotaxi]